MTDSVFLADLLRANAEINALIIDVAFEDILTQCENRPVECIIPSDQIKVKLTQDVINRLIEIVFDWAQSYPPDIFRLQGEETTTDSVIVIRGQFASLLDSDVVLGETHYSRLDGSPYDHSVRLFSMRRQAVSDQIFRASFWVSEDFNEEVTAYWNDDGNVVKFVITQSEIDGPFSSTREYFYEDMTGRVTEVLEEVNGTLVGIIPTAKVVPIQ